jgi:hypothetical protein
VPSPVSLLTTFVFRQHGGQYFFWYQRLYFIASSLRRNHFIGKTQGSIIRQFNRGREKSGGCNQCFSFSSSALLLLILQHLMQAGSKQCFCRIKDLKYKSATQRMLHNDMPPGTRLFSPSYIVVKTLESDKHHRLLPVLITFAP